jgi:hypothetical protein
MTAAAAMQAPESPGIVNSSFSRVLPRLQLAWDSTSIGALKTCPEFYHLSIVEGYQPRLQSPHLTFGILVHQAKETYDRQRASGADHDAAVLAVVQHLMCATWDRERKRPWASGDENKNRYTLLRTVVWYFEEYKDDPIRTVQFANGKPAVELSFSFESGITANTGEPYLLCGHIDRVGALNDKLYGCDVKTSKYELNARWVAQFSPHNQFTLYAFALRVFYQLPVQGFIVDGAQVLVTLSRFGREFIPRAESQLEEWFRGFAVLVRQAEGYARDGFWPLNETSCDKFMTADGRGGCPFRTVCARPPEARAAWLKSDFVRRVWDPLQVRGDV